MEDLKTRLTALPVQMIDGKGYVSYQAVTDTVAAFLFPNGRFSQLGGQMDAAAYQTVLETADSLCRKMGYRSVVKLTPPTIPFADMGLYWSTEPETTAQEETDPEPAIIFIGPGRVEMLEEGLLLDARLSQLGLDEVTRQHFKIPVTASDGVIDLMRRAVASAWPNDFKGLWHDILGMCVVTGKDISPTERQFSVIIRGVGQRRYWHFKAQIQQDHSGLPFLYISLANEAARNVLFALGHVVMTPGAADLEVDFSPYLARHAQGDWGEQDAFNKQQNDTAVAEGYRLWSAYNVPNKDGGTARIWIITEADRSATTVLLPSEY